MYDSEKQQYTVPLSKRHRVVIKTSEVKVLYHLMKHQIVPSRVLHDLFRALVKCNMASTDISSRLKRLTAVDILRRNDEPVTFNRTTPMQRSFYKLGTRGLDLLEYIEPRLSSELDELRHSLNQKSIPPLRRQTASILVNEVVTNLLKGGRKFKYQRAERHEIFLHTDIFSKHIWGFDLSPVYILEDADQIVCLVVNPSHEKIISLGINLEGFIINRYKKILVYAQSVKKKFVLVISLHDGSLNLNSRGIIRNIQDEMFRWKLSISPDTINGFHTYAFSTTRTVPGICDSVFSQTEIYLEEDRNMYGFIQEILDDQVEKMTIHTIFENTRIILDELYLVRIAGKDRLIGILYAREGDGSFFYKVIAIFGNTKNIDLFKAYPFSLWIIYNNPAAAEEDFLWNELQIDIWLTDWETWKVHKDAKRYGCPQMIKLTGINKKKYMEFLN